MRVHSNNPNIIVPSTPAGAGNIPAAPVPERTPLSPDDRVFMIMFVGLGFVPALYYLVTLIVMKLQPDQYVFPDNPKNALAGALIASVPALISVFFLLYMRRPNVQLNDIEASFDANAGVLIGPIFLSFLGFIAVFTMSVGVHDYQQPKLTGYPYMETVHEKPAPSHLHLNAMQTARLIEPYQERYRALHGQFAPSAAALSEFIPQLKPALKHVRLSAVPPPRAAWTLTKHNRSLLHSDLMPVGAFRHRRNPTTGTAPRNSSPTTAPTSG